MAEKRLDAEQQNAVLADANTVVVAGAGSGKTTVLARRFVHLVADEHIPLDRILTLTFTRKAAAEMHERIYALLRAHADDPFVAAQIGRFDEAQISTLDSFCGRIVRAAAGSYGISPDYRTDEAELTELARARGVDLLVRHRDHPTLARLVAANGFTRVLEDGLVPLGSKHLTLVPVQDLEKLHAEQLRELEGSLHSKIESLREDAEALLSVETASSKAFDRIRDTVRAVEWETLLTRTHSIDDAYLDSVARRLEPLQSLSKRGGNSDDPGTQLFKDHIDALRNRTGTVVELLETLRLRGELEELFDLVGRYRDLISDEKRRRGLLSYNDVLSTAVHALAQLPSLRAFFGARFDRIMIDEFQDNNDKQKQLLYLLSQADGQGKGIIEEPDADRLSPGKLFFVGDEKQSIYRFRGADVRAFKGLAHELSDAGREPIVLHTNYRSAPGLISVFNRVFSRVMDDAHADYEARFEELSASSSFSSSTEGGEAAPASFEILAAPKDYGSSGESDVGEELLSAGEAEAYTIAERIRAAVNGAAASPAGRTGPWMIPDETGKLRPPKYHEIAVLMRSSGNQVIFERVFRAFGIPYRTQGVRSLFLEAPAYDVYAWLRLVALPDDAHAYAAALRSPLAGVSDDAIGELLSDFAQPFAPGPELSALLPEQDLQRIAIAAELYARLAELADVEAHSALISEIWYQYGYRYLLLREPSYHSYLEHYEYLLELARLHEDESLAAFSEVLRSRLGTFERLDDVDVDAPEDAGVQIMTIHKSKGLEFPVVVLANAANTGREEGMGTSPFYISDTYGLTFNLPSRSWRIDNRSKSNYFFEIGKEEEKAQDRAELKRLLYVALTRAQHHIIVSGTYHSKNIKREDHLLNMVLHGLGVEPATLAESSGDSSPSLDSGRMPQFTDLPGVAVSLATIPDLLRKALYKQGGRRRRQDLKGYRGRLESVPTVELSVPRRDFSVTELVQAADLHTVSDADAHGEFVDIDLSALPKNPEATFGTIAHRAVDVMLAAADLERAVVSPDDLPPAVRRDVDDENLLALLRRAEDMARAFLASEYGSRLKASSDRVRVEEPFLLHYPLDNDELWISGQFDFLLDQGAEEPLLIVDLKTDREFAPHRHALQMFLYRRAAEKLFGRSALSVLHYLRYRRSVAVSQEFTPQDVEAIVAQLR